MSESLERIFGEPSPAKKTSAERPAAAARRAPSYLGTKEGTCAESGIDLESPAVTLSAPRTSRTAARPVAEPKEPARVPGPPHMRISPQPAASPPAASQPEQPERNLQRPALAPRTETEPAPDNRRGEPRLVAVGLHKSYRKGNYRVPVLRGVDVSVRRGEFLAIIGQSGSGKSTLLHVLGTLDSPDQGEICFDGQRIDQLSGADRDLLRNRYFGMIFQFYHLLPELTTLENVLAPLMIAENVWGFFRRRKQHKAVALQLLETVGLGHRLKHLPSELSGGEMQRAAIARALVTQPQLLLADEPTGNLDHETGREILDILCSLNRQQNLTIVMVTHDSSIAKLADRVVRLADGRIEQA